MIPPSQMSTDARTQSPGDAPNQRRPPRSKPAIFFAVLAAIAMFVTGFGAAGALGVVDVGRASPSAAIGSLTTEDKAAPVIEPGSVMRVHMTFYDLQGRLVFSTKKENQERMNQTSVGFEGPFVVPTSYGPVGMIAGNGSAPERIGDNISLPFGSDLLGAGVGRMFFTPALGAFSGYREQVSLERTRGPFNRTMLVPNEALKNLTTSEDGDRIVIDDLLEARVLQRGPENTKIQLLIQDGQQFEVRKVGFLADAQIEEETDQIYLHLRTAVGHQFSIYNGCSFGKYVLPFGSYRVESVNETHITMGRSTTKFPQLIERPLNVLFEVAEIEGSEADQEVSH
jgi:hypothetical protein